MKRFSFTRNLDAFQHITIIVKDENKFTELCEEHLKQGQSLNYWDLDDMDNDVVELSYGDIDWADEDYDEFYEVMSENNFPHDEEEYLVDSE
jgi:L-arabinose isomerase